MKDEWNCFSSEVSVVNSVIVFDEPFMHHIRGVFTNNIQFNGSGGFKYDYGRASLCRHGIVRACLRQNVYVIELGLDRSPIIWWFHVVTGHNGTFNEFFSIISFCMNRMPNESFFFSSNWRILLHIYIESQKGNNENSWKLTLCSKYARRWALTKICQVVSKPQLACWCNWNEFKVFVFLSWTCEKSLTTQINMSSQ